MAIVKFTHSGAQGPDWFPNGSAESHRHLYPKLISFIRSAQDDLTQQGFESNLEGIFWHTGENDTYFGPYANNNAKWMKQNELARTDPRITIIKTSELPHARLHFGTKGTLLLGESMADAYLK